MGGQPSKPGKLKMMANSAPCRAVMYLIEHDQLNVELVPCDLMKGEHMTPENLKENPKHTIPWYVEGSGSDEVVINDSVAIMKYLALRNGSTLYPTDPAQQAKVDEQMLYSAGSVYRATIYQYVYPFLGWGMETVSGYDTAKTDDVLKIVNGFLEKSTFLAGDSMSLADLQLFAVLACNEWVRNGKKWEKEIKWKFFDELKKYPALKAWYEAMAERDFVKAAHAKGQDGFCQYMASQ